MTQQSSNTIESYVVTTRELLHLASALEGMVDAAKHLIAAEMPIDFSLLAEINQEIFTTNNPIEDRSPLRQQIGDRIVKANTFLEVVKGSIDLSNDESDDQEVDS